MRLLSLLLVLTLSTTASAEPNPQRKPKSEMLAIVMTLGGIALSGALVVQAGEGGLFIPAALAGFLVLPSVGHIYAGDWVWTGIGVGSRVAGLGLLVLGGDRYTPAGCDPDFPRDTCERSTTGKRLINAGVVVLVGSLIVELFHAPYSVHTWNRRHQITVTPTAMSGGGGGLAIGGSF